MDPKIFQHLAFLYGEDKAAALTDKLQKKLTQFVDKYPQFAAVRPGDRFSEKDTILITYGDMVQEEGKSPLKSLAEFLTSTVGSSISTIHILPFYPYSSDDGFSVIDYLAVDPNLGQWEDIDQIGRKFRLMFDAVVNHISVQSDWFIGFLQGDSRYSNYFTVVQSDADLSQVFRPRSLPLLMDVETTEGRKMVWTTFSTDQADLNYAEPKVLFEVIDTLLFYVAHGAEFIRLDAIAFIWKENGTSCIHLPQTHEIVRLMRTVLDTAAPNVAIISETNVPHKDNITYFGNGSDEAQMVYNFSLPPLTVHTFQTGSAGALTAWAKTVNLPSKETTFFNFLASHDGVGVTPARGLLTNEEIQNMADRVEALGGYVSYKANPDGSKDAYELNINFLDALGNPENSSEEVEMVVRRFMAAQAIMLAFRGVPGIYFHSLFGSRNWQEGVEVTGRFRTINREKLQGDELKKSLADQKTLRHKVFSHYRHLLDIRKSEPAFHPNGDQEILDIDPAIFAIKRTSLDARSTVFCLQHVSPEKRQVEIPSASFPLRNLLNGKIITEKLIDVAPYGVLWLKQIQN